MNLKVKIKTILAGENPVKAFASVVIDDAVVIHDIAVIETEKGRHISMPRSLWKNKDGEERQKDICHPISSSARKELEEAVLQAYDEKNSENN